MSLRPTAWSSPCRRALSYWLVSFISTRGNRSRHPTKPGGPMFPPKDGTRPCPEKGQYHLLFPLLFVRCDVCCCGAVAPRVTAALLGRFLPRLGPLATASGPFFCMRGNAAHHRSSRAVAGWIVRLTIASRKHAAPAAWPRRRRGHANGRRYLFRRRPVGAQLLVRERGKPLRQRLQVGGQTVERGRTLEPPLVHIERAVELELDGMQPGGRIAVVLGDEASGIGLVAADRIALAAQRRFDRLGHRRHAACAVAVA